MTTGLTSSNQAQAIISAVDNPQLHFADCVETCNSTISFSSYFLPISLPTFLTICPPIGGVVMDSPPSNESLVLPTVPLEEQMPDAADDLPSPDVSALVARPLENPQDAGNNFEIVRQFNRQLDSLKYPQCCLNPLHHRPSQAKPFLPPVPYPPLDADVSLAQRLHYINFNSWLRLHSGLHRFLPWETCHLQHDCRRMDRPVGTCLLRS